MSECSSDCPDMAQAWSQTSWPEEWTTVQTMDNSTSAQPPARRRHPQGVAVTAEDIQALNTSLLSTFQRPVDLGLSPVLSHESQSSYTLNTLSEPDSCLLPPGLDISFAGEPTWQSTEPFVYNSPAITSQPIPGYGFAPSYDQSALPSECSFSASHALFPGSEPSTSFPQVGQAAYPRRTLSYPHVTPVRPILPREGTPASDIVAHGPQRALRPQVQGPQSFQRTVSSVSSPSGRVQSGSHLALTSTHTSGYPVVQPHQAHLMQDGSSGPMQSVAPVPTLPPFSRSGASMPSVSEPSDDVFSCIHFDQEDQATSPEAMSYIPGYALPQGVPSSVSGDVKPVLSRPDQELGSKYQGSTVASGSSDSDEGRYRNHPLYNQGPASDGLYHCPYKAEDPNCPHKPTKLKCNYDKFIDSHLKPFRCKVEACAKQEFSSTACLLRHEREAHGMHGHGERPHVCQYPGCERSIPGNGFPRRYNLYDHMKRVHDHKEDVTSATASPVFRGDAAGQRRAGGRKRKASPTIVEPTAQRRKATAAPMQQVVYQHGPGCFNQQPYEPETAPMDQQRQRMVFSHWANQKEALARQITHVSSPDDEVSLERFSQNMEHFRRLSAEARRR